MLTKLIRRQLTGFMVITVIALTVMGLQYVQIPQMLGIGRYNVDVQLKDASGLYPKAVVTYRGYEVGDVTAVDIRDGGGVTVRLQIDNGTRIPVDAVAQVRSTSVVGEQYVNFEPPGKTQSTRVLADGAVVPASRTLLPTSTTELLTAVNDLASSVPRQDLRTLVDELGQAFDNSGDSYGRLIDASSALQKEATKNLPQTIALLDDLAPVLGTQQDLDPAIRKYATGLDSITSQLAQSDAAVRSILTTGSPLAQVAADFVGDVTPALSPVLSDTAQVGEVLKVYMPGIEHILTILPALVPAFNTATPKSRLDDSFTMANLYFKLGLDPPPCTVGFVDADKQRNPDDLSVAPIPQDSYCKASKTSQLAVRGARNNPCPHDPTRRSATAAGCGYIFDDAALQRRSLLLSHNADVDLTDGAAANLIAPNGLFFLLDPKLNSKGPQTWQSLLTKTAQR
jgi:phospholipid/cholesterol/gamma-HCH transport system substrate-binding protein